MKKGVNQIYILVLLGVATFLPIFCMANTASSERYNVTDQVDYSGGSSSSENYQVFGMLTDMSQIVFWPSVSNSGGGGDNNNQSDGGIPISLGPIIDAENLIPTGEDITILGTIFDIKMGVNTPLGQLAKELNIPLATVGLALTLVILLLSQLFGGIAILSLFGSAWSWFLALFDFGKKKERYGMVYDAEANAPISRAVVQIFENEYNKLLSTQITDQEGRFLLFVGPGKYYIKVIKSNYAFPSKSTTEGYHGTPFVVNQKQELLYKIPLDPDHEVLSRRINLLSGVIKFFNVIRIPVIILGTIFAVMALYENITTLNLVVACLYIVIWILELYKLRKTRPYGITKDKNENIFIDRVILRLFNRENKLVSTQISDSNGRYNFLANPGNYKITAVKTSYEQYKKNNLTFKKSGRINLDIPMDKNKPKIQIIPTISESNEDDQQAHNVDDSMHPSWV